MRGEARELVEQREMALRIEQRLVFVLPVQLDERLGLLVESRRGDQRVVEKRAAASLRRDVAAHDELAAGRRVEHRLHGAPATRRCGSGRPTRGRP